MGGNKVMDSGQARLEELGYRQVLKRSLSVVSNFAMSFSLVCVLAGVSSLYSVGLRYGGTISLVYGWLITGFFNFFVAFSMAEICSAYPTTGGLYFWSSRLAGPSWGPFAGWITGWVNVFAQWAVTGSANFTLATMLQSLILLATGGANGGGYLASKYVVIAIDAGLLFSQALLNSLSITVVSFIGTFASAWNLIGVMVVMILVPLVSTERRSAHDVFTSFNTGADAGVGINSAPYIFLLGTLVGPWAFIGYDASVHLTEETKASDRNASYGIISAVTLCFIFGWAFILGMCFATPDLQAAIDPTNDAGGYAIAQVFYSAFKSRYGNGTGGIVCLGAVAVALYFAGLSCITSNSRMVFAFSRDGAIPLSKYWRKVDKRDVPINAVWISALIGLLLGLTSLGSVVAYQALVSIATIGSYIAYVLPTLFRITVARNTFVPGPLSMGRNLSLVVGTVAVLYVTGITVLFSFPLEYPINRETLNYTPIVLGGVIAIVLLWWIVSARKWFKGPVQTLVKGDDSKNGFHSI